MELYNAPEQGHAYMIQGTESNSHFTGLLPEQFQAMYSEGAPEFVLDQGMYYPTATNYGYFCTGYESPGDWDDHSRVFGLDGQDIQYTGAQIDSLPYVYYTPSYGYTESPYNPYNPYIPGAMIGVDGPIMGAQEYYTVPSYDVGVSSPAYFPMVVQSRSDIIPNSLTDPFIDTSAPTANRGDGPGLKHNMSSTSSPFNPAPIGPASSQTKSFTRVSEGNKSSVRTTKQPVMHGVTTSAGFPKAASSQVIQGRGAYPIENVPHGKDFSSRNQLRVTPSTGNGSSSFGSSAPSRTMVDRVRPKFLYEKINEKHVRENPDVFTPEHNPGPRTNNSKNQFVVKAYTRRAGDVDEQGYITINTEQYNREDFQVDFPNAKFFVIKSYSEDDVHKSIKYNVWSSTPNGNKKLHCAYEDVRRIAAADSRGCPVFLFFSVNASGQFCGVAEMTGPVDLHKDMDFWQQDKWTGSFPVKWHIIKDVPNPNFRHVLLENNENKPVTNSRDTQEIPYKKGIEMLKMFKNHASRTSLLDDFMYYENRQKILQEEKARLLIKNYGSSFIVPVLDPPRKLHSILDLSSSEDEKIIKHNGSDGFKKKVVVPAEQVSSEVDTNVDTNVDNKNSKLEADGEVSVNGLQVGSLTISPKQSQAETFEATTATATAPAGPVASTASSVDVVAVGSMPVKVNGFAESSGFLTVGTIPLDPRALQHDEAGLLGKNVPKRG